MKRTDTESQDDFLLRMMRERLARIERGERSQVDEEEMHAYPLLPETSVMHYFSAPSTQDDYPGYKESLDKYTQWAQSGLDATAERLTPTLINFLEILNIRVEAERRLRYETQFIELVMRKATKVFFSSASVFFLPNAKTGHCRLLVLGRTTRAHA
jgi:hypothetical protein